MAKKIGTGTISTKDGSPLTKEQIETGKKQLTKEVKKQITKKLTNIFKKK